MFGIWRIWKNSPGRGEREERRGGDPGRKISMYKNAFVHKYTEAQVFRSVVEFLGCVTGEGAGNGTRSVDWSHMVKVLANQQEAGLTWQSLGDTERGDQIWALERWGLVAEMSLGSGIQGESWEMLQRQNQLSFSHWARGEMCHLFNLGLLAGLHYVDSAGNWAPRRRKNRVGTALENVGQRKGLSGVGGGEK